jgi:hypothetical protein
VKKPAAAPKPAAKKAAPAKAVPKKAAPKKPAAKKPVAGKKGAPAGKPVTAHQAHLAHLAHLARLGLIPAPAPKPQRRMLALGDGVACCAAEAVAASLRLAGRPVSDADVLALYRRTADDPDTGATILATLEAACEFGLAGVRPTGFEMGAPALERGFSARSTTAPGLQSLILGVDLPGPHAVLDDGVAWWSWGELYDPACWPDAVIEEAWTLTWG